MNRKFIETMARLPFDRTVEIIDELAIEYRLSHGALYGEVYRNLLVNRLIRCVQGVM